jgi:hypothetical protein
MVLSWRMQRQGYVAQKLEPGGICDGDHLFDETQLKEHTNTSFFTTTTLFIVALFH